MDSLAPDQRAVLQLVLQRGRSFDEIAEMLAIDRAAVRGRALAALDALGPDTELAVERRALICDYLLGQLPAGAGEIVARQLARSATDRSWARALAAGLAPLARRPLPAIPEGAPSKPAAMASSTTLREATEPQQVATEPREATEPRQVPTEPERPASLAGFTGRPSAQAPGPRHGRRDLPRRRSSRLGGAILLGLGAIVVIAVVLVVVLAIATGGSSGGSGVALRRGAASAPKTTTPAATTATGSSVTPLAQIRLSSPTGGKESGAAEIVRQNGRLIIAIEASDVPPNSQHNAYAVWLSNRRGRYDRLGFVNPPVGSDGVLQTSGGLPSDAASYDELVISLETARNPQAPSRDVVLEGSFKLPG
jgi:hypothetical protein